MIIFANRTGMCDLYTIHVIYIHDNTYKLDNYSPEVFGLTCLVQFYNNQNDLIPKIS